MADELNDPKRTAELTIEDVVDTWREHQMLEAGYPPDAAHRMSTNHSIDLHRACEMLAAGCRPLTAEMILT